MAKKNITINDLAVMVKKGFDGVDNQFKGVNNRLDKVEVRLGSVEIRLDNLEEEVSEIRKHQVMHTIYRDEFERLDNRVKTLEKLLVKKS